MDKALTGMGACLEIKGSTAATSKEVFKALECFFQLCSASLCIAFQVEAGSLYLSIAGLPPQLSEGHLQSRSRLQETQGSLRALMHP